jgi:hypothetical protein
MSMVTQTIDVDAFLADSVVSAEGKLYTQGAGWNVVTVQSLPARHDRIGIGVLIRVPYTATNQNHSFEIRLEDADGKHLPLADAPDGNGKVEGFGGQFNVGRPPQIQPGDEQIVPFAVNINGLMFETAGQYRFVVSIDGTDAKELPFRIMFLEQPQPIIRSSAD